MLVEPRSDHVVWLDGEFVPWHRATMHVSAHHYGVGVFEGVRSYASEGGAAIFRLHDHTKRFLRSARILSVPLPDRYDVESLSTAQAEVLRRNRLRSAYIRPFTFYSGHAGVAPRTKGLTVHVAVLALEWREEASGPSHSAAGAGLSLQTSSFTRYHANSVLTRAKANANYLNGILAVTEAQRNGADDALLLDAQGYVTETSGANVFIVRDRTLYTPPLECVLDGITRDTVFTLAGSVGLTVLERRLTRDDVYAADEAFVTGTAAEIAPIRALDGRTIGDGTGPITGQLRRMYADHTRGRGEHRSEWLTSI